MKKDMQSPQQRVGNHQVCRYEQQYGSLPAGQNVRRICEHGSKSIYRCPRVTGRHQLLCGLAGGGQFQDAIDHSPNRNISVWQTFDDSMYQLRTLPELSSWNGIPPASPAIQYMVAKTDVVFKKHHLSPVVCSQAVVRIQNTESSWKHLCERTSNTSSFKSSKISCGTSAPMSPWKI
uniref:Uncharacterized protein n=1 Tax=Caenorhabditis japonica TaxID=281687 RepID=A0A8R1EES7_CAEJA